MKKLLSAVTLAFALTCNAHDYSTALANLTDDFATCAAYFNYMSIVSKLNNWAKQESDYHTSAVAATTWVQLLMKDKPAGWIEAKIDLMHKVVGQEYDKGGVDGLIVLHSEVCKLTLENHKARLQFWLEKTPSL